MHLASASMKPTDTATEVQKAIRMLLDGTWAWRVHAADSARILMAHPRAAPIQGFTAYGHTPVYTPSRVLHSSCRNRDGRAAHARSPWFELRQLLRRLRRRCQNRRMKFRVT